jgi:hypothetical protein
MFLALSGKKRIPQYTLPLEAIVAPGASYEVAI